MNTLATRTRSYEEIAALVRAFEGCTLSRSEWQHAEHILVALWYLRRLPRPAATDAIRSGIQRYNEACGRGPGYHETITLAWVAVVAGFLGDHDFGQPLEELAALLLDRCGDKDYLLRYWSRPVLLSDEARRHWVPPDLEPIEPNALQVCTHSHPGLVSKPASVAR